MSPAADGVRVAGGTRAARLQGMRTVMIAKASSPPIAAAFDAVRADAAARPRATAFASAA
ncbi:hypothetical protein [Lysobacter gummosus]|uniref:hypothetical protein n=1 Tax=Lysobacter gummosus TaxID=262324 RepID=UPI0036416B51